MNNSLLGSGGPCFYCIGLIVTLCCDIATAQPRPSAASDALERARNVKADTPRRRMISIEGDAVTLKDVKQAIEETKMYSVMLDRGVEPAGFTMRLYYRGTDVRPLLEKVTKDRGLDYMIDGDNIIIKLKPSWVKIYVKDSSCVPLPSAGMEIGGKKYTTNAGGYRVVPRPDQDSMVVSYLQRSYKVAIQKGDSFTVYITPGPSTLSDAFVTTSASSEKVETNQIFRDKNPIDIPATGLGKSYFTSQTPEVRFAERSGIPGSRVDINIRGWNSLDRASPPLFVIDGTPFIYQPIGIIVLGNSNGIGFNPLSFLPEGIIEKIFVVKDVDSLGKYGTRGANGVIYIVTAGKKKDHRLSVNLNSGFCMPVRDINLMDSRENIAMRREAFGNDKIIPDLLNAPDLFVWDTTRATNWNRTIFKVPAHYTDASISGGIEGRRLYYHGIASYRQEEEILGNHPRNYLGTIYSAAGYTPHRDIKITAIVIYTVNQNNQYTLDQTSLQFYTPFAPSMMDSARRLIFSANGSSVNNVLAYNFYHYGAHTRTLVCNLALTYTHGAWEVLINGGSTSMDVWEATLVPAIAQDPTFDPFDMRYRAHTNLYGAQGDIQVKYHFTLGNFKFLLTGGSNWYMQRDRIEAPEDTTSATDLSSLPGTVITDYKTGGVFFNINTAFKQWIFLDITNRWDISSRMAPYNTAFYSRAAGLSGILFHQKNALKYNNYLPASWKLHLSLGETGSDAIGDYLHQVRWSTFGGSMPTQLRGAIFPSAPANSSLYWERITKTSIGTTIGLLKERLNIGAVYYTQKATDLPVPYTLPSTTGFNTEYRTWPATIMNWGWELNMEKEALDSSQLKWISRLSINIPRNRLQSYYKIEESQYATTRIVGQPLEAVRLYKSTGVDAQSGVFGIKDYNGDKKYDTADMKAIGTPIVKMYGSWINTLQTKKWRLYIVLEGVIQTGIDYQRDLYNLNPPGFPGLGSFNNETRKVLNRWQKPGDHAKYQRFTTSPHTAAGQMIPLYTNSTGILENASFLRLRTLTLSYDVTSWLQKIRSSLSGQIYIQGQNLLTLTPYADVDPAIQSALICPLVKSYGAGIKLNIK